MATLSYEKVRSNFLSNITDYNIATQDIDTTIEVLGEYLHKSVATPYVRKEFATISLDDPSQTITYTLNMSEDDESDEEYVINILGNQMVSEWIKPRLNDVTLLAQLYSGKEAKWYSQANHMAELRGVSEDALLNVRRMIRDRASFKNKYLEAGS